MQWQPIETAPKDGTWLLVTGFKKGKRKTISHLYVVAAWFHFSERYPEKGGYWYYGEDNDLFIREPTHWADLPMLPARV